ncbi:MAG: hypothetical protein KA184_01995 [Candidatus Hydrogenedentes bacterium]|nr:hypothetical protein [Candidatus Hydrogenedentota bacterium]
MVTYDPKELAEQMGPAWPALSVEDLRAALPLQDSWYRITAAEAIDFVETREWAGDVADYVIESVLASLMRLPENCLVLAHWMTFPDDDPNETFFDHTFLSFFLEDSLRPYCEFDFWVTWAPQIAFCGRFAAHAMPPPLPGRLLHSPAQGASNTDLRKWHISPYLPLYLTSEYLEWRWTESVSEVEPECPPVRRSKRHRKHLRRRIARCRSIAA